MHSWYRRQVTRRGMLLQQHPLLQSVDGVLHLRDRMTHELEEDFPQGCDLALLLKSTQPALHLAGVTVPENLQSSRQPPFLSIKASCQGASAAETEHQVFMLPYLT